MRTVVPSSDFGLMLNACGFSSTMKNRSPSIASSATTWPVGAVKRDCSTAPNAFRWKSTAAATFPTVSIGVSDDAATRRA